MVVDLGLVVNHWIGVAGLVVQVWILEVDLVINHYGVVGFELVCWVLESSFSYWMVDLAFSLNSLSETKYTEVKRL